MSAIYDLPPLIKNPDPYLRPDIRMSPFSGKMEPVAEKSSLNIADVTKLAADKLSGRGMNGYITNSGREAISLALADFVNRRDYLVSIITTSNIGYVSGCVTKEIEKHCKWVFGYRAEADAYFIIHEFGRYASIPEEVKASGKPIIEDCAYAFIPKSLGINIGNIGDYIIYSLPKAFSMQYGGLLLTHTKIKPTFADEYLLENLHDGILNISELNNRRVKVYHAMQKACLHYGLEEFLPVAGKDIAHAFIVALPDRIDQAGMRSYMNDMGVESSVFYGSNAYFLPCHYNMNEWEIAYIFYHVNQYVTRDQHV